MLWVSAELSTLYVRELCCMQRGLLLMPTWCVLVVHHLCTVALCRALVCLPPGVCQVCDLSVNCQELDLSEIEDSRRWLLIYGNF